MILSTIDPTQPKGWFVGPWNSPVPIAVGYANEGKIIYHEELNTPTIDEWSEL